MVTCGLDCSLGFSRHTQGVEPAYRRPGSNPKDQLVVCSQSGLGY